MPDAAHKWTDEQLEKLEKRISREYSQAAREMHDKERAWLAKFDAERRKRKKSLDTPEAVAAYKAWLENRAYDAQWYRGMVETLAQSASRANVKAAEAVNDTLPRIYAENANFAAYSIDKDISLDTMFIMVDEDTVRNLMQMGDMDVINREVVWDEIEQGMESVQSIRVAEIEEAKDIIWNRQKFNAAITQGILQGESIPNIVKRLDSIFGSNKKAAIRAARTATTSAENAGRVSSYKRAESIGIELKQEWLATLDMRTRTSHRKLDGEKVEVGKKFSNQCRFPGDPQGPAHEVWNCRCTLVADVDDVDQTDAQRWSRLPEGMTYDEWKKDKPKSVLELKDENGRWKYESKIVTSNQ